MAELQPFSRAQCPAVPRQLHERRRGQRVRTGQLRAAPGRAPGALPLPAGPRGREAPRLQDSAGPGPERGRSSLLPSFIPSRLPSFPGGPRERRCPRGSGSRREGGESTPGFRRHTDIRGARPAAGGGCALKGGEARPESLRNGGGAARSGCRHCPGWIRAANVPREAGAHPGPR